MRKTMGRLHYRSADTLSWGAQVYLDGKISHEIARQREKFFHCFCALSPNKTAEIHPILRTPVHLPLINVSDTNVFIIVCYTSRVYIRRLEGGRTHGRFCPKKTRKLAKFAVVSLLVQIFPFAEMVANQVRTVLCT
jgi:hypothetical protein